MNKIHFTPEQILKKKFKQKLRGYDPTDVDSFLDMVIRDYETYSKETQALRDENDKLRHKVDQLNQGVPVSNNQQPVDANSAEGVQPSAEPAQSATQSAQPQLDNATAMDILKRLSNLENHVYGSQNNGGQKPSQF